MSKLKGARESREMAVLLSGGVDSAVLAGELLRRGLVVHPLYVRCGHRWEQAELGWIGRFLEAVGVPELRPLHVLDLPVSDLLEGHWSVSGPTVPDGDTPDEAVYLPGRNVLLLGKAMLWCHLRRVDALAIGTLSGNPFPDATPAFSEDFAAIVNRGIGGRIRLLRPFADMTKAEVLRLGGALPLELTFSCLHPAGGRHCGACNKCAERRKAFVEAGLEDRTAYLRPASPTSGRISAAGAPGSIPK
jgi:7-cyano-7-deazaguanine synthase